MVRSLELIALSTSTWMQKFQLPMSIQQAKVTMEDVLHSSITEALLQ